MTRSVSRLLASMLLCTSSAAVAQAPADHRDMFVELTPVSEQAIEKGLQFLAANQLPSGAWTSLNGPNGGISSLAMLAFLATGNVPEQGKYAELLNRGLTWILSNVQPSGLIHYEPGAIGGEMYEHALATLVLAEVYGMTDRPEILASVHGAVRVILNAQNKEGGWRYHPYTTDADMSVTVMQILALKGAQQAGMQIPPETIQRAIQYVKRCADTDGGFRYQIGFGRGNYPRTGAGVTSLEACGEYDCEEVRRGLDYLVSHFDKGRESEHEDYAFYYAAQAVYQAKDQRRWQEWFPRLREKILSQQQPDGHWSSAFGSSYSTSMRILALSIPYRYLPIYQR
jgi:hypothetical protein